MHRVLSLLLSVALLALPLAGCTQQGLGTEAVVASGIPTEGDPGAAVDARLGDAITAFGFALLAQAARTDEGNYVISPLSVHASVAMTYNGASGETAQEMASAMALSDLTPTELNQGYANLLASLAALPDESAVTLNVENSLWADEGLALSQEFIDTDRGYYGAQLETLDLQTSSSRDRINDWIAERTNDKITDLIDEVPGDAVLYLVNAVYLNGDWSVPFDPEETVAEPFTTAVENGRRVGADVPMMRREGDFGYVESEGTQAVRLPYGDGRIAMWIVLPPESDADPRLEALAQIDRLADAGWDSLTARAATRPGLLVMPIFTSRTKTELSDALSTMGMPIAFDTDAADFSGMGSAGGDMFISRVLHETYIAVDESGTEAAAATGTEMGITSAPIDTGEPFEMRVNRPFLFAIEDGVTGAMLFLGVINDPR
ncbi:MAG: serpin family protein [Coriobacteriia bacterium]